MKTNYLISLKKFFHKKSVFITGGTGSLGKELINTFLRKFNLNKIVIFSRDELKQYNLQKEIEELDKNKISRFFLGDVRDLDRLKFATKNIDYLIHAAALKHVDQAEYNPLEFIKTNIEGAKNIIEASFANNIKKIIALSTDKAANPINLYGATKLVSDKLFTSANNISGSSPTRFSVVRYGNVANSRGSILPFFLRLTKIGSTFFPITDPSMTRFWITLEQSVDLVLKSFIRMHGGEIFVPKTPSVKILDLAKSIDPKMAIKIIGIRPGEKLSEILCSKDEFFNTIEFQDHFVIKPSIKFIDADIDLSQNKLGAKGKYVGRDFEYSSSNNKNFLSITEIKKIIEKYKKNFS